MGEDGRGGAPGNDLVALLQSGPTNAHPERGTGILFPVNRYRELFMALPEKVQSEVTSRWGNPATDPFVRGDTFHLVANALGTLPPSALWSIATWNIEGTYSRLVTVRENQDMFFGMGYGVCRSNAALTKGVPPPFSKEPTGGGGIRMHHKFVVVDFDKPTARVYLGSYNFSSPADTENGENLLLIRDRRRDVRPSAHRRPRGMHPRAGDEGDALTRRGIPPALAGYRRAYDRAERERQRVAHDLVRGLQRRTDRPPDGIDEQDGQSGEDDHGRHASKQRGTSRGQAVHLWTGASLAAISCPNGPS